MISQINKKIDEIMESGMQVEANYSIPFEENGKFYSSNVSVVWSGQKYVFIYNSKKSKEICIDKFIELNICFKKSLQSK